MPRKRKTQSGAPAQGIPPSVPGVRYGEGVEHQQLARTLPPADMRHAAPAATPQGAPEGAPGPVSPMANPEALMAQLQGAPLGMLSGSQRPNEPVTAGLPTGPGPGPEVLRRGTTPLARTLANLAARTGNENYARLASKAGLR